MEIESILVIVAAAIAIAYYVYAWYKKARTPESPGGTAITSDEWMELIKNPDVLNSIEAILKELEKMRKAKAAETDAVPK
jgi:preprotein translocase subunit Sec63